MKAMFKVGDMVQTTVVGSMQSDRKFKVLSVDNVEWDGEKTIEYTLAGDFGMEFQAFEDSCY